MLCSMIGIALVPTVLASGKSVYGTLYIDGEIADPGISIQLKINGVVVDQTTTVEWNEDNFIFGFNSSYEGEIAYFYVGADELVPNDNASVIIGSWIGKQLDLHVTTSTSDDDDSQSGTNPPPSGGGTNPPSGDQETDDDDSGYYGGGGSSGNRKPIAEAGGPYAGLSDEPLKFNGSASSDPDGDDLSYTWDFGDGSETQSGILVEHVFEPGNYTIELNVSDGSLYDTDTADVSIGVGNLPPTDLTITGDKIGSVGDTLSFSISANDPDGDLITYYVDWDDGSEKTISSALGNGMDFDTSHSWDSYGIYELSVYAMDGSAAQSNTITFEVAIDAVAIEDESVSGMLVDDDSDGSYEHFVNANTGKKMNAETKDDGTTVFDSDGDDDFDRLYDPDTETVSDFDAGADFPWMTIGIVILLLVIILLFLYFIFYRRPHGEEEQTDSKTT